MSRVAPSILIIGSGLIGTSIGMAMSRAGADVYLIDRDPAVAARAEKLGGGRAALPSNDPDVVIVAVPPRDVAEVAAAALRDWPNATVTDVCSVKGGPMRALSATGADMSRWVGGHPMAGREVTGPDGARRELFNDRVWVVAPSESASAERIAAVMNIALTCGATPVQMSADDHDRAVALTSHVPQVLSSVLAGRVGAASADHVQVSGQGLRDMTRIAASDPALWTEILSANPGPVRQALEGLIIDLEQVRDALAAADPGTLRDMLERGNEGRAAIPGKHGGESTEYDIVPVLIADEPGALSEVFVAAGGAGFNLEDVRIDHVLGRPSGLVEVSVRVGLGDALAAALRERGFDVRY